MLSFTVVRMSASFWGKRVDLKPIHVWSRYKKIYICLVHELRSEIQVDAIVLSTYTIAIFRLQKNVNYESNCLSCLKKCKGVFINKTKCHPTTNFSKVTRNVKGSVEVSYYVEYRVWIINVSFSFIFRNLCKDIKKHLLPR